MSQQQITNLLEKIETAKQRALARAGSPTLTRVAPGFYFWADADGAVWELLQLQPDEGTAFWMARNQQRPHSEYTDGYETLASLKQHLMGC